MSEDVAARLRSLAKEHMRGQLTLDTYRQLRRPLLDSLTGSDPPAAVAKPVPRVRARTIGWLALGAIVAAALAVGLLRTRARGALVQERVRSETAQVTRASSDRIFALVAPLLKDSHWTEARIEAVNADLLEEGPQRIAAVRGTEWFQRFVAEVRRRLDDQGAGGKFSQRSSLAALASTIGAEDP